MKKVVKFIAIMIVCIVVFDVWRIGIKKNKHRIAQHHTIPTNMFAEPISNGHATLVSNK